MTKNTKTLNTELNKALRLIPSVESLLKLKQFEDINMKINKGFLTVVIRRAVEEVRNAIIKKYIEPTKFLEITKNELINGIVYRVQSLLISGTRKVVNASGVILHTGLGRAVLPPIAMENIKKHLDGYSLLSVDNLSNERVNRERFIREMMKELTGAEYSIVVNNNSAATMLILQALSSGKEVIISRGELIEIGGSFRLPDILKQSGAKLVEVGTTNRTYISDYENAINENTGMIVRVHTSNYTVKGFSFAPALNELVNLAHSYNIPLLDDLGSGALFDVSQLGLEKEPLVSESISAGADLVCFSGDKLIGATQSGIICGKEKYVKPLRKHPLFRALRISKIDLVGLEATLKLFYDKNILLTKHPLYKMLNESEDTVKKRARKINNKLKKEINGFKFEIEKDISRIGGGALPLAQLPTYVIKVIPNSKISPGMLSALLRLVQTPVFTRIKEDVVVLDVRTINDTEINLIIDAFNEIEFIPLWVKCLIK